MRKVELKSRLRQLIPKWCYRPILNCYRLLKFIFLADTSNSHDLQHIHDLWLACQKSSFNDANLLCQKYLSLHANLSQREICRANELKVFSQHGEDGLILYIFSKIGVHNHTFIEFGAGGRSSNTENLIVNFGWSGLLIDADERALSKTIERCRKSGADVSNIKTVCAWITRENINELFLRNGFKGEVDLLSIDIDGNDYWVWEAVEVINPRLVVIEYNASLGWEESITVKYDERFDRFRYHPLGWYHGASLKALEKLGERKGYALVACESSGVNAFFVRNDLLKKDLKKMDAVTAYYPDRNRSKLCSPKEQFDVISHLPFVRV